MPPFGRTPPPTAAAAGAPPPLDLSCILDGEWRLESCDPRWFEVLGCPPGDVIGLALSALVVAEDREQVEDARRRLGSPGHPTVAFSARLQAGSGAPTPMTCRAVLHAGGHRVHMVARDPSARPAQRREFDELARHLREILSLVDSARLGLNVSRLDGTWLECSPAFLSMLGYADDATAGLDYWALTPPEYSEQEQEQLRSLETTGRYGPYDKEFIRKDGQRVPVRLRGFLIERDGEPVIWSIIEDRSGAHRLQQRAAAASDRASVILQTVVDGVLVIDSRGIVSTFSPGAERIFGYAADEVIGHNLNMLMPPGPREAHDGYIQAYEETGEARIIGVGREVQGLRKDGSRVTLDLSVNAMHIDGEQLYVGLLRDVTERKAAEAEIRAAGERLELATAAAGIGIWDWNIADDVLSWDAQMYQLYGVQPSAFAGAFEAWKRGLHPDDVARGQHEIERALSGEAPFDTEFRVVWPDGSIHHIKAAAVVRRDAAGNPVRMIGTNWDITAVRQAEAEIEEKNRALEASSRLDRASAAVMLALNEPDSRDPTEDVLRILADHTGCRPLALYSYDEWKGGLSLTSGLSMGSSSAAFVPLQQGLVGEAAQLRQAIWIDGGASPLRLDAGFGVVEVSTVFALPLVHRGRLLGVVTGASARGLGESEKAWLVQIAEQVAVGLSALRQYQELRELSTQLNERSRRIEEQNQELARANRLKTEFLASMSHELRTPLNAIIGFSEVLKDGVMGALSEDQADYVTEIFTSGHHLLSLINDILDLSKIEAGKMTLDIEPVALDALVSNALSIVKERANQAGVTVGGSVAPGCGALHADARKVRQIVYNLLSNAVKFTPSGGEVRLEIGPWEDGVELSVTDTGIGIDASDFERLFHPFEQLEGGIDRRFEGTGLGLSLVKRFAELHGGDVHVESEPGRGSRFRVRLPGRARANGGQDTPPTGAPASPRIVLVESDPAAVALTRGWLEGAGYTVQAFSHPSPALADIVVQPPDAVLLDLSFSSGADGWDLLEGLRSHAETAQVPVIIVSIDPRQGRGLALGASAVLQKPIGGEELLQTLHQLGIKRGAGAARGTVLVVDDDPRAVDYVSRRLESAGITVTRSFGGVEALRMMRTTRVDAVVLDLMMPGCSGIDVLQAMREDPALADLPVIVLTAKSLEESERQTLERLVTDVLLKGEWEEERFLQAVRASLRRGDPAQPTLETSAGAAPPPPTVPALGQLPPGRRVLVVDDDPAAREVVALYLRDAGHEVESAESAETALQIMGERPPDLVVLDLFMPGMGGFAFLQRLSADPTLQRIPVIAVSAAPEPERAEGLGASAVLSKPASRHDLLALVQQHTRDGAQGRPTRVLVVDDDARAHKVVRSYFEGTGFALEHAYGGAEALERLGAREQAPPDLVVLDLMMPEISGFEVLERMRSHDGWSHIPVVVLTANQVTAAERSTLLRQARLVLDKAATSRGDLLGQITSLVGGSGRE